MANDKIFTLFSKTVQLSSERLIYRKMCKKDAADMYVYASLPEVTRFLLWSEHPNILYTKRYLSRVEACYRAGQFFDFSLVDRASGHMIGTCGFTRFDIKNNSAEIGYVLHPAFWNQGLATEAAMTILQYGFDVLGLHRIEARYMIQNQASRRVMEKCGMHFEGVHHGLLFVKGAYRDIGIYARIHEK